MTTQLDSTDLKFSSRRGFLKRAGVGLAALVTMGTIVNKAASDKRLQAGLPGSGSLFEPRKEDLLRHWKTRLSRFRLK